MVNEVNKYIPIIFQKISQYEDESIDTRFVKVKIWLMHIGENLNGSFFAKEVVEEAIYSLANTPILAYIEDNSEGEKDFSDHRQILVIDNNGIKIKYLGKAIGIIPETNNAQFEFRLCDDGIEREFLTVEGLLWTKFDDPIDIMNRDTYKSESMEIHNDYEGDFQKDGLFHFTKFKFYGACGLGKGVTPAMTGASIELDFAKDIFQKEIQEKMEQFKLFQNQTSNLTNDVDINNHISQGGNSIVDEKLELLKKYNVTKEQLKFSIDELTVEELENRIKEQVNSEFTLSVNQIYTAIDKALAERKVIGTDWWGDPVEEQEFYSIDLIPDDKLVIAVDCNWNNYYGISYTMNGDIATLDYDSKKLYMRGDWREVQDGGAPVPVLEFSKIKELYKQKMEFSINKASEKVTEEVKSSFNVIETEEYKALDTKLNELQDKFSKVEANPDEKTLIELNDIKEQYTKLKGEFDKLNENFSTINTENGTLKTTVDTLTKDNEGLAQFKADTVRTQREDAEKALFSKFEVELGEDDLKTIKENASNYSLDELEIQCFALLGKKKAQFSYNPANKDIVVPLADNNLDNKNEGKQPYGSLSKYFKNNS